jgi:hypothetical protein
MVERISGVTPVCHVCGAGTQPRPSGTFVAAGR